MQKGKARSNYSQATFQGQPQWRFESHPPPQRWPSLAFQTSIKIGLLFYWALSGILLYRGFNMSIASLSEFIFSVATPSNPASP